MWQTSRVRPTLHGNLPRMKHQVRLLGPSAMSSTKTTVEAQPTTLKLNITLHKQIIDLLANAGTKGMTLSVRMYHRPALDAIVTPSTGNLCRAREF
jgi:hypothetical protein